LRSARRILAGPERITDRSASRRSRSSAGIVTSRLIGGLFGRVVVDLDRLTGRATIRKSDEFPFDQLQMQRLKKRKLMLKDQISKIESELLPDIIA
jgi:hypothetical protein